MWHSIHFILHFVVICLIFPFSIGHYFLHPNSFSHSHLHSNFHSFSHSLVHLFLHFQVRLEMMTPTEYTGALMDLGQTRRGIFIEMKYLTPERSTLIYEVRSITITSPYKEKTVDWSWILSQSNDTASVTHSVVSNQVTLVVYNLYAPPHFLPIHHFHSSTHTLFHDPYSFSYPLPLIHLSAPSPFRSL